MSSSRVMYQGLQSCLEQNSGVDARVLKLKLAFPKSNLLTDSGDLPDSVSPVHQQPINDECETNLNMGGWSFLQSLSLTQPKESAAEETQKVYVHPLTKRSASTLSKQSLEMCTESLGSETGSSGGSDIDSLSLKNENENGGVFLINERCYTSRKKMSRSVSFPPPLTSMSCSNGGVQMRPFREDGRLILKAVPSPSVNSNFHADRSHGRLRLRMVNPMAPTENEAEAEEQEKSVFYEDEEEEYEDDEEEEEESFVFEEERIAFEEEEVEEEESFDFEEEEEGNMKKLSSRSERRSSGRCNEVRLPQLGWEPFWVAT